MHLCSWSYRTAGNALKGKFEAKYGVRPQQWAAVALEAVSDWRHRRRQRCVRSLSCTAAAALYLLRRRPVRRPPACAWRLRHRPLPLRPPCPPPPHHPPPLHASLQTAFPEAGNQPAFPSPILRPGEEYRNQVVWRFYDVPPAPTPTEAPASASAASLACPAVLAGGLLAALLLA